MARTKRKVNPLHPETAVKKEAPVRKTYKAAAYIRLSVEDSGNPGSDTLESQKRMVVEYIQKQPDIELAEVYLENGKTGTNFDRPEFERMMDAVRSGSINCIVVKDLSRLGRSYIDCQTYIEEIFPFLGVRFISINDHLNLCGTESMQDSFTIPLKNLLNDMYSKDISKKVSTALHTKQKSPDWVPGRLPYGYMKDPEDSMHMIIDEETAPTVRQIFKWKREGLSVHSIVKSLEEAKIPSPYAYLLLKGRMSKPELKDAQWTQGTVKRILSNQVYLGHMVHRRTVSSLYDGLTAKKLDPSEWIVIPDTHEPIVDEETFQIVQEKMQTSKEAYEKKMAVCDIHEHSENMLAGLLRCGHCGKSLYGQNVYGKNGEQIRRTFSCRTHSINREKCPFRSIREEVLKDVLFTSIKAQIETAVNLTDLIKKIQSGPKFQKQKSELQNKIDKAKSKSEKCESMILTLYQNFVEGVITAEEFKTLKEQNREKSEAVKKELEALEKEQADADEYISNNKFLTTFSALRDPEILTRELIETLVENIYIYADKRIEIKFRYMDEFEKLQTEIKERMSK